MHHSNEMQQSDSAVAEGFTLCHSSMAQPAKNRLKMSQLSNGTFPRQGPNEQLCVLFLIGLRDAATALKSAGKDSLDGAVAPFELFWG